MKTPISYFKTFLLASVATAVMSVMFPATLHAQQYPVQVTTVLTPPYSLYLSDYAAADNNALQLIIQLRELDRPEYRVKLRFTIEGQGIILRTKPSYVPRALVLQGGVPEILTGPDVSGYLNPDNLDFSGISKQEFVSRGTFPEGFYTFKVEVLDYVRNVVVSNPGLANAFIILNDPPLINLPFNNEKVIATEPQNVMFSWTPRHTASPNAAFNTAYEFRLVELYPANRNPNDAIRAANSIFVTETSSTSLNYSVTEPLLIPGRKYAFRVRAYDVSGRDLFKNDGYSEVHVFQFGDACIPPTGITAQGLDDARIKLLWDQQDIHTGYGIKYRKQGATAWEEQDVFSTSVIIPGLQSSTIYEYQVKGLCGTIQGDFSQLATIATLEGSPNEFTCGAAMPPVQIDQTPLENDLKVDDRIKTADFEIVVTEITANADGSYKGKGRALIPWFKFASARVKFSNIKVNQEYRVYSGNVSTIYNPNSQFVARMDLSRDQMQGDSVELGPSGLPVQPNVVDTLISGVISSVTIDPVDGSIVITDSNGGVTTLPRTPDNTTDEEGDFKETRITDSNGNTFIVNRDGSVTNGLSTAGPGVVTSRDSVNFTVQFAANETQQFGFDKRGSPALGIYDKITIQAADYYVPWKAVKLGTQDPVNAIVEGRDFPASIGFKTANGPALSQPGATPEQKTLIAIGAAPDQTASVSAYVLLQEPGQQTPEEIEVGRINVTTYSEVRKKLFVIPVGNAAAPSIGDLTEEITKIYQQAVAEWDIEIGEPFNIENEAIVGLDAEESGMLASYNQKMRQFNRAFERSRDTDNDAYYIFLINGTGSQRAGIMPFKRRYGYVFLDNLQNAFVGSDVSYNKTITAIAHEIAHGAFNLRHPFDEFSGVGQRSSNNLMDYKGGRELRKYQWDYVHDPEAMIGWLQDDDDAAFGSYEVLVGRNTIPGSFTAATNVSGNLSFVTTAGKIITLPNDAYDITFQVNGTLLAFTITEDGRAERYVSAEYTASRNFAGFRKNYDASESSSNDNIYKDRISKTITSPANVYIGLLDAVEQGGNADCGVKIYTSNLTFQVFDEWHSGGNRDPQMTLEDIKSKLNTSGGDATTPRYGAKVKYLTRVSNPQACEGCSHGQKFIDAYSYTAHSPEEFEALQRTAEKICMFPDDRLKNAFTADNDANFKAKVEQFLLWPGSAQRLNAARSEFWSRSDAWQIYEKQLNEYIDFYSRFKNQIAEGKLTNSNLKAIINARSPEFLDLYTIEERIAIIQNLLPQVSGVGFQNYTELYVSNGEENAIINVLKSPTTKDEADQMLTAISASFIRVLTSHLNDFGFGGNNYTRLAQEFQRLTLLKHEASDAQKQKAYIAANPNTYFLLWNDDNLFLPKEENGIVTYTEVTLNDPSELHIEYKVAENCVTTSTPGEGDNFTGGASVEVTNTNCDYLQKTPIELDYFTPIVVTIAGDFDYLSNEITTNAVHGTLTYAGFIHYLNEQQTGAQIEAIADYTVTGASLAFGVGELVLIIRAGATAGRIAIVGWEVGGEIIDACMKTESFRTWCAANQEKCSYVKAANLINQIAALGTGGYDIVRGWNEARAAANAIDNLAAIRLGNRASSLDASILTKLKASSANNSMWVGTQPKLQAPSDFLDEVGTNLIDLTIDGKYYVKYDVSDGRLFLGDKDGNAYYAFVQEKSVPAGLANEQAVRAHLATIVTKLENYTGLGGSRKLMLLNEEVTIGTAAVTTLLGRYYPDISNLLSELGDFKNVDLGEVPGGINILNRPDSYTQIGDWWTYHNRPWLQKAIDRGDDIYLATLPTIKSEVINADGSLRGAFAHELKYLVEKDARPKNSNLSDAQWFNIKSWFDDAAGYASTLMARDIRAAILNLPESEAVARKYFARINQNPSIHLSSYTTHLNDFNLWYASVFKSDLFEAHHIIPKNVLRDNLNLQKILDWANKNGKTWNFGGIDNGIMLQKRKTNSSDVLVGDHANHPNYDAQISQKIDDIYALNNGDLEKSFEHVEKFVASLKQQLNNEVIDGNFIVNTIVIP